MSPWTLGSVTFCSVTIHLWFYGVPTCHSGLFFPAATSMEQRLPIDTPGRQGMQEIIPMEWKLMEPSAHWFTAGPHGMLEPIPLCYNGNARNKGSTVAQWDLMESKRPCDALEMHGTKALL